jgi:hypothetical protein
MVDEFLKPFVGRLARPDEGRHEDTPLFHIRVQAALESLHAPSILTFRIVVKRRAEAREEKPA